MRTWPVRIGLGNYYIFDLVKPVSVGQTSLEISIFFLLFFLGRRNKNIFDLIQLFYSNILVKKFSIIRDFLIINFFF